MIDKSKLPSNELAEAVTVGACVSQADAVVFAAQECKPTDFTIPVYRWIAEALWQCLDKHTPPTIAQIIDNLEAAHRWAGERVSPDGVCYEDIRKAQLAASDADIDFVRSNARLVRKAAFRRNGHQAVEQASRLFLDTALDESEIHQRVNAVLEHSFDGVAQRCADLESIERSEQTRLASPQCYDGIPTGLRWLDTLTGGFMPSENVVIGGAYKARKTTLALNMVLAAARSGAGVSVFTNGDSTRDETYRKLLAMEMTRRMAGRDEFRSEVSARTLRHPLTSMAYAELRQQAADFLTTLPIRLYDGRDMIGNLGETARILRRDVLLHGVKLGVYDYAQTITHGVNDYEKSVYYSAWVQNLTGELGVPMLTLSQINEATIKDGASYSPGAKGGGALPAMANAFLVVSYLKPTLKIELKLARDADNCEPILHKLAPASGLILDGDK